MHSFIFLQRLFRTGWFKPPVSPNGPKIVAGGSLSPRDDWCAPSDAGARLWLEALEREVPDL